MAAFLQNYVESEFVTLQYPDTAKESLLITDCKGICPFAAVCLLGLQMVAAAI